MLSEIDMQSLNELLARLLGISKAHFNMIESSIFVALGCDTGFSEEKFKTRLEAISKLCLERQAVDVKVESKAVVA